MSHHALPFCFCFFFRFTFLRCDGNSGVFGDEFVYDRFERRFVSAEDGSGAAMRRGHSDLRLDRSGGGDGDGGGGCGGGDGGGSGEEWPRDPYGGRYYYYKNPRYSHQDGGCGRGRGRHVKELVHTQEQLEPQLFKTIIFLSGR